MKQFFAKKLYDLVPYIPGEQPSSKEKVIKLNTNENPYPPSATIQKVIREILEKGYLRKYPQPTSLSLREAIAKHHNISPDMILVTNGSDEGLALLFRAVLEKNSKVVIPYPTYSLYPVLVDSLMNGSKLQKIPLREDLHFDFVKLKKAKGNLLAFASPNAPTGILEEKEKLLDLVSTFSGIVLCDEAYVDFSPPNSSLIPEVKNFPNLVVSRTFSKSYSLAGLRVGYLVSNSENISLILKLKDSYNLGMLEQAIAKTALLDQKYFSQTTKKIIASREFLSKELLKLGFKVVPSSTNFLFVQPPSISPEDLFLKLKERKIYIRYFKDEISKNYVRISVGNEKENKTLIQTIQKILR